MKLIGVILFVGFLLTFGVALSRSAFKDDEYNQNAMWVVIAIILVAGILAIVAGNSP